MTHSCTASLEMSALLFNIGPGDEVIMPSYTFVSTANAFALRGARIIFIDSRSDHPGMDERKAINAISDRTKAMVAVHYAGVACDMDPILNACKEKNIPIVEDAAHSISSFYKDKTLGSLGDLGCFSFHETKNIISGEGGMLAINNSEFVERAEILWEKGTNRQAFFRGEVDKYNWVDLGSSFLPSDSVAAILKAQLEKIEDIQSQRIRIWNKYNSSFQELKRSGVGLPFIPEYASQNGHMFYLVLNSLEERTRLAAHLKQKGVLAVFHYQDLNSSPYFKDRASSIDLKNSLRYTDQLLRLPLFYELKQEEQDHIITEVIEFFS